MAVPGPTTAAEIGSAGRDHAFHPLRIAGVVQETADARSYVLDIPADLRAAFAYEPGQFCTFRVWIDGQPHLRCYSMSSAPSVDTELQVTVKRVPGGLVSNWMDSCLAAGDTIDVTCPAGVFVLAPNDGDVVAFSAGSGITPVFSLIKSALATSARRVRLLYANRDRDSVIFSTALDALASRYADRLEVVHHFDSDGGFVDADAVRRFTGADCGDAYFVCGPAPFMDIVETELLAFGADAERIRIERFIPAPPSPSVEDRVPARITIELDGRAGTTDHHPGTTILQAARQLGLTPPYSCESGSCATCMARLVEGEVSMFVNNALTDAEVADGWVLTCQSVPTSASVRIRYEGA